MVLQEPEDQWDRLAKLAKQEKLEKKEPEGFKVQEAWRDKKEPRAAEVPRVLKASQGIQVKACRDQTDHRDPQVNRVTQQNPDRKSVV